MSTTTAVNASLTATNAALAARAAESARQARIERCKAEMLQYEPKAASIAQMQSYAACVQTVHPVADPERAAVWKWVVAALMIWLVVAFVVGWIREGGVGDGVIYAVFAFLIAATMFLFGLGIIFVIS